MTSLQTELHKKIDNFSKSHIINQYAKNLITQLEDKYLETLTIYEYNDDPVFEIDFDWNNRLVGTFFEDCFHATYCDKNILLSTEFLYDEDIGAKLKNLYFDKFENKLLK